MNETARPQINNQILSALSDEEFQKLSPHLESVSLPHGNPPVRYSEFNSLLTGLLISSVVGNAGGLATADDVRRREMIELAATGQVAIVPAWLGSCLMLGFLLEVSLLSPSSGCS